MSKTLGRADILQGKDKNIKAKIFFRSGGVVNVVSINKVIFASILILLGGLLVSCSRSGDGEAIGGYDSTAQDSTPTAVEDFDFSAHMRISDTFVRAMEKDLSYVDVFDGDNSGIHFRGFTNGERITVRENRLRVVGSASFWNYAFAFGAKLNGEIIPHGNPHVYDYLKYGIKMPFIELGFIDFLFEMDLAEGENVVEFMRADLERGPNFRNDNSDFQVAAISSKRIYVYYRP